MMSFKTQNKDLLICLDGSSYWSKNKKRHREEDKAAVILNNGTRYWFHYGKIHRVGGKPAFIIVGPSEL